MPHLVPRSKFVSDDGLLRFRLDGKLEAVPPELEKDLAETALDFFNQIKMAVPGNADLPFFAYGLFKPGQLGFDSLHSRVVEVVSPAFVTGALFERDGVPLFADKSDHGTVDVSGALITFAPGKARSAYETIASLEPEKQYMWETKTTTAGVKANVLVSKSSKGAHHIDESEWDGRRDPHFHQALKLVNSILDNTYGTQKYELGSAERLFELQMAYLLLWTSIERYTSLRYHLRKKVMAKIRHMAGEPGFKDALREHVKDNREVYSTDAGKPLTLSPDDPQGSLDYYYQVRSNVVHRGKALKYDAVLLNECITELLAIFQAVLKAAFAECEFRPERANANR